MMLMPMLDLYTSLFDSAGADTPTGRKGRVFTRLCSLQESTRKKLAEDMGIRPATMSELMLELINDGFVFEARPSQITHKGRPEIILRVNKNRLVGLVCYTVSQTLNCALVNLAGEILHTASTTNLSAQTNSDEFFCEVGLLIEQCLQHLPEGAELVGLSMSLPGIVDEEQLVWQFSSHWPKLKDLEFSKFAQTIDLPVVVLKNLNCELRARMMRKKVAPRTGHLLLHWGFGIGAAFLRSGDDLNLNSQGSGEVGHGCVDTASTAKCKCGMVGCVEAEAGLWAIAPKLAALAPPKDERLFEAFLHDHPELEEWDRPISLMAATMRNLCVTLSPEECVVTGPFAQNTIIFGKLVKKFEQTLPTSSSVIGNNRMIIRSSRAGASDEVIGASSVQFAAALSKELFR